MRSLIFVLITLVELVYGSPIIGGLLGTTSTSYPNSRVNPSGLAHPANGLLGKPLCGLGLACMRCKDGILHGLDPLLGGTLNGLGLGADCEIVYGGRGGEDDGEKKKRKKKNDETPTKKPHVPKNPIIEPPVTEPPVTQPPVTEPPITQSPVIKPPEVTQAPNISDDCFEIQKPIRETDNDKNNWDWDDCDDEQSSCDDCDCENLDCDDCDCEDNDCADVDCDICGLIN